MQIMIQNSWTRLWIVCEYKAQSILLFYYTNVSHNSVDVYLKKKYENLS